MWLVLCYHWRNFRPQRHLIFHVLNFPKKYILVKNLTVPLQLPLVSMCFSLHLVHLLMTTLYVTCFAQLIFFLLHKTIWPVSSDLISLKHSFHISKSGIVNPSFVFCVLSCNDIYKNDSHSLMWEFKEV